MDRGIDSDRDAIEALVRCYCDVAARADFETFRTLWTPEARWTGPGLRCEGIHAIADAFARMRARVASADPQIHGGAVTVDADGRRATGWWEIAEHIVGHDGRRRTTNGRYDDEYALMLGSWKFRSRAFTPAPAAT